MGILCQLGVICLASVVLGAPDYYWSVCNNSGSMNCQNGIASDQGIGDTNGTHVSVVGFYVFFAYGQSGNEETGLAEFVFQDRLGVYQDLNATRGQITYLKLLGMFRDYKKSGLSIALELELITDGVINYYETKGSRDDCNLGYAAKSLVIHGNEPWELLNRDGSSVCIQVHDTASFVPGIVRDVRSLGFDHDRNNICAVVKGCTQEGLKNITLIHNHDTFGVLRR